jgi:hypothetical protein
MAIPLRALELEKFEVGGHGKPTLHPARASRRRSASWALARPSTRSTYAQLCSLAAE